MEAGVRWAKQISDTQFTPEAIERALHEGFSQVQIPVGSASFTGRRGNGCIEGTILPVSIHPGRDSREVRDHCVLGTSFDETNEFPK